MNEPPGHSIDEDDPVAVRKTRAKKVGKPGCMLMFCVVGLADYCIGTWILGATAIATCVLAVLTRKRQAYCGACSKQVAPISPRCPHCEKELSTDPAERWGPLYRMTAIVLVMGALCGGLWALLRIGG